ncbi:hypothetical protein VI817_002267 [Penicillium citrinum]|nr:hypothetical protein VI817_002267 [Penicillium citrinum]
MVKRAVEESPKPASKLKSEDVVEKTKRKSDKSESKDKKKRKTSDETDDGELKKKKKRRYDDSDEESSEKKKKTKKRVSFGPGTKTEDGEASTESDNDAGDEAEVDNGKDSDTAMEDSGNKESEKALEEMKKRKREKKKERKSGTTPQIHETPILSYLSWYHRDRASWKFQKNRETNIFRHLYSLEHVPSAYNVALLAYLQGLKGEASKMRLSQGAADVMSVDKEVEANEEYQKTVEGFRESLTADKEDINATDAVAQFDDETGKRLQKRQRAELVFFAVTGKLYIGQRPAPPQKQEPPPQKKRKNRTVVVDISSSESDSDSDSSSGDSDETLATKKASKTKAKATPVVTEPKEPETPAPSKNKKKQKRKVRTAQIEISSSESGSDSD